MRLNRGAVGVVVVSLALSGAAIAVVLTPPRHSAPVPVNTTSAADQAFVHGFYAAKERLVRPDGSVVRLSAEQRREGYAVGDDYVASFRDSYTDDPGLLVKSVDLQASADNASVVGDQTTFRVTVSMYFQLEGRSDHNSFTGGEVDHHVLTVRHLDGALRVVSDQSLGN